MAEVLVAILLILIAGAIIWGMKKALDGIDLDDF